jgi:CubicO group peptidase (beta-lactamase class C family)
MSLRICAGLLAGTAAVGSMACQPLALREPASAEPPGWRQYVEPEDAGFSGADLRAIREAADSSRSAAVMVVYRGNVVAAWGDVRRGFRAHSIRKSFAGALYGIAVDRGFLRLDATLAQLGIDDIDTLSATERTATFRDLVSSRSGVYHPAAYADAGQTSARPPRNSARPGTRWFYNNWDFNVAETILENRVGASLYALLDSWIARPLGMEDFRPSDGFEVLEPSNSQFPAHTVRVSARDLARFGQLYLNGGLWNGRVVVPKEWIDSSLAPHSELGDGAGYGYLWWTYRRGTLPRYPTLNQFDVALARGTGGQALFLIPGADLVVVHSGDTDNGVSVSGGEIWSIVERIAAARRLPASAAPRLGSLVVEPLGSQLPPFPAPPVIALDDDARAQILGEYSMPGNAVIRIFEHEGRLFINVPGEGEAEMFATDEDAFFLPGVPGVSIALSRQPDGTVEALNLIIGSQRLTAARR